MLWKLLSAKMKIKFTTEFRDKLNRQIDFIASDKPGAARIFKNELLVRIRSIASMPFSNRRSVFFDDDTIRELVFKGYIVVYKVDKEEKVIKVFGFTKFEENPFR